MRLLINTENILSNIEKARTLTNVPISLMFKDFYDYIYKEIADRLHGRIFGMKLDGSVCYSVGKATHYNTGTLAVTPNHVLEAYRIGIKEFYIPIEGYDEREGLCIADAYNLAEFAKNLGSSNRVYGLITSGCTNECCPSLERLTKIYDKMKDVVESISLGGSFWLANGKLPVCVKDIRIGEYMLFGTIPYSEDMQIEGKNGIILETEVLAVYPERHQFIIDCGYSKANIKESQPIGFDASRLQVIESSSEYSIISSDTCQDMRVGEKLRFKPDYKSLVTLKDAERRFI